MTDLFGGLPRHNPAAQRHEREADILLTAVPPYPGALQIDGHAMPAARVLERRGAVTRRWSDEQRTWEIRRTAAP